MDPSGMIEYGKLSEGSYFGDISILNDEPNEYSYYFDPFTNNNNNDKNNKPLEMLEIEGCVFK